MIRISKLKRHIVVTFMKHTSNPKEIVLSKNNSSIKMNHNLILSLILTFLICNISILKSENNTYSPNDSLSSKNNFSFASFKNTANYTVFQDDDYELIGKLRNMPNIEVGKGITFMPSDKWYKMTMRFRMQNMVG